MIPIGSSTPITITSNTTSNLLIYVEIARYMMSMLVVRMKKVNAIGVARLVSGGEGNGTIITVISDVMSAIMFSATIATD